MKKKNSTTTTDTSAHVKIVKFSAQSARTSLTPEEYTFVLNLASALVLKGISPTKATNDALKVIQTLAQATIEVRLR